MLTNAWFWPAFVNRKPLFHLAINTFPSIFGVLKRKHSLRDTPVDFQKKRMALSKLAEIKELMKSIGDDKFDNKTFMEHIDAVEELLLCTRKPVGLPYSIA